MGECSRCGSYFPTCYMDTVSICPNCSTTFYNDSSGLLNNVVGETPAYEEQLAKAASKNLKPKKIKLKMKKKTK